MDEITQFIADRDRALANLDMAYARRMLPMVSSDAVGGLELLPEGQLPE